jgi:hypothetical protein
MAIRCSATRLGKQLESIVLLESGSGYGLWAFRDVQAMERSLKGGG